MKKFDPKIYTGRTRIFKKVNNRKDMSKLWIWNHSTQQYEPPIRGMSIYARKKIIENGKPRRIYGTFETVEDAVQWQSSATKQVDILKDRLGPSFEDAVISWTEKRFCNFENSTKGRYKQLLASKAFSYFKNVQMSDITPRFIDDWLSYVKNPANSCWQKKSRTTFKYELDILSGIIQNFINYDDDNTYQNPIKERHYDDCKMVRNPIKKKKELSEDEFKKFRSELSKGPFGEILANLATVQFYQALRIHEACGIHFENISLDVINKENSTLTITQSVIWPREKDSVAYLKSGFKNSKANGGYKIQYLYPESYFVFQKLQNHGSTGLVFQIDGEIISYKKIQYYFTRAFKKAGLEYSSTHVLRHGGSSAIYNSTGDFATGQALLGNKSVSSSQVYLHTSNKKLKESAKMAWDQIKN